MTLVIGTDEAGYGPNLGPLVVAASAWRLDCAAADAEGVLERFGAGAAQAVPDATLWGDSKEIYRAGAGLAALERGVLVGLLLANHPLPADWPALAAAVGAISPRPAAHGGSTDEQWLGLDRLVLPCATTAAEVHAAAAVADGLCGARMSLAAIACCAIYPAEFNALLDRGLNKSDILSQATLALAAEVCAAAGETPALGWCDRHGGRKSYAHLVAGHFAAPLVNTLEESPTCSAYAVPSADLRIEFRVGGETRLPVALASMTAKYVRELAMSAFNGFWSARLPGLAPTAGYPVDAKRWRDAAAACIQAAGIADDELWRRS